MSRIDGLVGDLVVLKAVGAVKREEVEAKFAEKIRWNAEEIRERIAENVKNVVDGVSYYTVPNSRPVYFNYISAGNFKGECVAPYSLGGREY